MATQFTQDKNAFIADLISKGTDRKDIEVKYTAGGVVVVHPIVGEDGKPHLVKTNFKKS